MIIAKLLLTIGLIVNGTAAMANSSDPDYLPQQCETTQTCRVGCGSAYFPLRCKSLTGNPIACNSPDGYIHHRLCQVDLARWQRER